MSEKAKANSSRRHAIVLELQNVFIDVLLSASQRVNAYFWDMNGSDKDEESICKFWLMDSSISSVSSLNVVPTKPDMNDLL